MLSIVSATSSAPSQRGSSSSPEPQACARAACRCPAAVFQNPVRSSFWLQSLFPDWPSRLGRRSQAQETVFQALGRGQACDTGPRRLRESSTRPPHPVSGQRPRWHKAQEEAPEGPGPWRTKPGLSSKSSNHAGPPRTIFLPRLQAAIWPLPTQHLFLSPRPKDAGQSPEGAEAGRALRPHLCPHIAPSGLEALRWEKEGGCKGRGSQDQGVMGEPGPGIRVVWEREAGWQKGSSGSPYSWLCIWGGGPATFMESPKDSGRPPRF